MGLRVLLGLLTAAHAVGARRLPAGSCSSGTRNPTAPAGLLGRSLFPESGDRDQHRTQPWVTRAPLAVAPLQLDPRL